MARVVTSRTLRWADGGQRKVRAGLMGERDRLEDLGVYGRIML